MVRNGNAPRWCSRSEESGEDDRGSATWCRSSESRVSTPAGTPRTRRISRGLRVGGCPETIQQEGSVNQQEGPIPPQTESARGVADKTLTSPPDPDPIREDRSPSAPGFLPSASDPEGEVPSPLRGSVTHTDLQSPLTRSRLRGSRRRTPGTGPPPRQALPVNALTGPRTPTSYPRWVPSF